MPPAPETNPYAPPQSAAVPSDGTEHDRFIIEQAAPLLQSTERVLYTAFLVRTPSPWLIALLFGGVGGLVGVSSITASPEILIDLPVPLAPLLGGVFGLAAALVIGLVTRPYLTAVTNQRILLFRTRHIGLRPQRVNLGVEEIRWKDVERIEVGGIANNRSLEFAFRDGARRTLRIGPWARFVSGQRGFFEYAQVFAPPGPGQ